MSILSRALILRHPESPHTRVAKVRSVHPPWLSTGPVNRRDRTRAFIRGAVKVNVSYVLAPKSLTCTSKDNWCAMALGLRWASDTPFTETHNDERPMVTKYQSDPFLPLLGRKRRFAERAFVCSMAISKSLMKGIDLAKGF
ncbi:hypothetical protein J6590_049440 [Homalodisca vitripennis]|nr:hypothetical protein J6590_049440 [Homalodisca vitripennis]